MLGDAQRKVAAMVRLKCPAKQGVGLELSSVEMRFRVRIEERWNFSNFCPIYVCDLVLQNSLNRQNSNSAFGVRDSRDSFHSNALLTRRCVCVRVMVWVMGGKDGCDGVCVCVWR